MVRLKKNRWYSAENQHRLGRQVATSSGGMRRLVALIFLLALVLLVMQRVSDPGVVRRAFQAIGVPLDREVLATSQQNLNSTQNQAPIDSMPVEHDSGVDSLWLATCNDLVPRILKSASPVMIEALARYSFSTSGETIPESAAGLPRKDESPSEISVEALAAELASFSEVSQNVLEIASSSLSSTQGPSKLEPVDARVGWMATPPDNIQWKDLLNRFSEEWAALLNEIEQYYSDSPQESRATELPSHEFRTAVTSFLDDRMVHGLRDAAPWRPKETLAFWRMLQRGGNYECPCDKDPPLISTQQLEADFPQLKAGWVRFRGTVRRVDFVKRAYPAFQLDNYRVLWLQGADGSSQPVAVYTTFSSAKQLEDAVAGLVFPEVEVIGLVGKRLAYASPTGLQIAPTLFAGSLLRYAPDTIPTTTPDNSAIATQALTAGLVAMLISLLFVIPAWIQFRSTARTGQRRFGSRIPAWLGLTLLLPQASIADQVEPPWATQNQSIDTLEPVARQRLNDAIGLDRINELEKALESNQPVASSSLLRVLYALDQIGWNRLWALSREFEIGDEYRLRPMELSGWVVELQPLRLDSEQQEWFSIKPQEAVYRVTLEALSSGDRLPNIVCMNVPKFWLENPDLRQPALIRGFALERVLDDAEGSGKRVAPICEFAGAPSWISLKDAPESFLQARPALPQHLQELAEVEWDLYWLELLRDQNEKSLSASERAPFLKLLQVASQGKLPSYSEPKTPLEVMRRAQELMGCNVDWQVRLVSGSRVETGPWEGGASQAYYQFDGFVKIPGQKVEYIPAAGKDRLVFDGEFPVTVVSAVESEFVPLERLAAGELSWKIGRHARVQGKFYRMWSYRSERLESKDGQGRQLSPLVVGVTIEPAIATPLPDSPIGWFGTALCIGVVLILTGIIISVYRDTFRSRSR